MMLLFQSQRSEHFASTNWLQFQVSGYWVLSNIDLLGFESKRQRCSAPLDSHPTIFPFCDVYPMCDYINHVDCIFILDPTLGNHPLTQSHSSSAHSKLHVSAVSGKRIVSHRACKDLQAHVLNTVSEHIKTWLIMKWCVTHIEDFAIAQLLRQFNRFFIELHFLFRSFLQLIFAHTPFSHSGHTHIR